MPLLNYRTTVPVSRTIGEIHQILVKAGAKQIASEYGDDGTPVGVAFATLTPMGLRSFRLPVEASKVLAVLRRDSRVASTAKTPAHADRVAWRIIKDWLEAQLALLETEMVALDQVMLPYMVNEVGRSIYDLYCEQQLALGPGA